MHEHYAKNNQGKKMVDDTSIRNAWREHYNQSANKEFEWDINGLDPIFPVQGPPQPVESCKMKETVCKRDVSSNSIFGDWVHKKWVV